MFALRERMGGNKSIIVYNNLRRTRENEEEIEEKHCNLDSHESV